MNDITLLLSNFFGLFMESAPWLLLGLLVAGIMHELVPVSLLQKHMGERSMGAILKASVIGAPLPLCSCGVIPAALGLRRSGASKPATISFLVSTPETGVDSVTVSYALLGPVFAIVRPIAAILSAVYAGVMVKLFAEPDNSRAGASSPTPVASSCCSVSSSKPSEINELEAKKCYTEPAQTTEKSSCCSSSKHNAAPVESSGCCSTPTATKATSKDREANKVATIWGYATGKLLEDITVWLLIGLALAAAIQTWVPSSFLTQWGDGFIAMFVMALIGVPMYICATASTPLAVGFLAAGLSPGAILVFLLAGPATNISTMGMIGKELGRRSLILYIFSILTASIGLGYLLNIVVSTLAIEHLIPSGEAGHIHGEGVEAIYALCAVLLGGLMLKNSWQTLKNKFATKDSASQSCCH